MVLFIKNKKQVKFEKQQMNLAQRKNQFFAIIERVKNHKKGDTMIIGIWAEDEQALIGKDGRLPWHLPIELQHFKKTTMDQVILMGRKTFDGMNRRVLPGRTSIILTRDLNEHSENDKVLIMHSLEEVLDWYKNQDKSLFITGGAEMFELFEPHLELFYRTIVHEKFEGDAYFPQTFDFSKFKLVSEVFHEKDEKNPHDFTIKKYKKVN